MGADECISKLEGYEKGLTHTQKLKLYELVILFYVQGQKDVIDITRSGSDDSGVLDYISKIAREELAAELSSRPPSG